MYSGTSMRWTELPPTRFPRLGNFTFLFLLSFSPTSSFARPCATTYVSPCAIATVLLQASRPCALLSTLSPPWDTIGDQPDPRDHSMP